VGLTEVAESYRAVDCGDDLGKTNILWVARQDVATADAAFRLDQARALERQQNLFEVWLRERGSGGDVAHRSWARLAQVQR